MERVSFRSDSPFFLDHTKQVGAVDRNPYQTIADRMFRYVDCLIERLDLLPLDAVRRGFWEWFDRLAKFYNLVPWGSKWGKFHTQHIRFHKNIRTAVA